jgi:hypothetical protein
MLKNEVESVDLPCNKKRSAHEDTWTYRTARSSTS